MDQVDIIDRQLLEAAPGLHGKSERMFNTVHTLYPSNHPGRIHIDSQIGTNTVGIVVLPVAVEIPTIAGVNIIQQQRRAGAVDWLVLVVHAAVGFPQQGIFLVFALGARQHLGHGDRYALIAPGLPDPAGSPTSRYRAAATADTNITGATGANERTTVFFITLHPEPAEACTVVTVANPNIADIHGTPGFFGGHSEACFGEIHGHVPDMAVVGHFRQPKAFLGDFAGSFIVGSRNDSSLAIADMDIGVDGQTLAGRTTGAQGDVAIHLEFVGGIEAKRQQQFGTPLQRGIFIPHPQAVYTVPGTQVFKPDP